MYKTFKGYQYRITPFGYFEIYHLDRFIKFDTLKELKHFINEYEASIEY